MCCFVFFKLILVTLFLYLNKKSFYTKIKTRTHTHIQRQIHKFISYLVPLYDKLYDETIKFAMIFKLFEWKEEKLYFEEEENGMQIYRDWFFFS